MRSSTQRVRRAYRGNSDDRHSVAPLPSNRRARGMPTVVGPTLVVTAGAGRGGDTGDARRFRQPELSRNP